MSHARRLSVIAVVLLTAYGVAKFTQPKIESAGEPKPPVTTTQANPPQADPKLESLLAVIRPQKGEDLFETIPWQTSLWDARILAAKSGKPILLWEMDGHPLGCG